MFLRARASLGLGILLALALAGDVVAGGTAAGPIPIFSTTVVIHVTYAPDCTFTMTIDGGITVDSSAPPGVTIPPGPYQLAIRTPLPDADFNPAFCTGPLFSLTGPDVNYSPTVAGGTGMTANVTFSPSTTYEAVDGNRPSLQKYFTTAATGSSSSLLPPPPADTGAGTSTQPDLVGSGIAPMRGSLHASVSSSGAVTLAAGGRKAARLEAGRYSIVVEDRSARRGFFVQKQGRSAVAVAGARFTGKRTVVVNLTAGTWRFYAQASHPTAFLVSG